jgi:LuxR family maltose regulon positive regulatory protein
MSKSLDAAREQVNPILIDTKLQAPLLPEGEGLISRTRLVELVRANFRCKLVLVSAPAGYGKTTFLAEWKEREQETTPFAWISLDPNDRDPIRLCAYVIEAVDRIEPGFGDDLRELLRPPGIDFSNVLLPRLVNALAGLSRRIALVFDDYHLLKRRSSNNSTGFVLDHLPRTVQLVISTRSDPPISLRRLRASGETIEIKASDLHFDEDQVASLLAATLGFELRRENLDNLLTRTEGWPAGLYLATLSLKGHPNPSEAIHDFVGDERHLVDYLTEEVLERQSPEVKRFLLRTSVLQRLRLPCATPWLMRTIPHRCSRGWSVPTSSSCLWTSGGYGTVTTSSPTSSAPSFRPKSRRSLASCTGWPVGGSRITGWSKKP